MKKAGKALNVFLLILWVFILVKDLTYDRAESWVLILDSVFLGLMAWLVWADFTCDPPLMDDPSAPPSVSLDKSDDALDDHDDDADPEAPQWDGTPDPRWLAEHLAEHPDCPMCDSLGWR